MDKPTDAVDERELSAAAAHAGELLPDNLPPRTRGTLLCGVPSLRGLVSKNKLRFVGGGVDLDLSYVTDRVIAMGYPSSGLESYYRNPTDNVRSFLEERHAGHYRIWNLCSEREYGPGSFPCEIERFAWADHTPPPLALVRPACESLDSWLYADPANVVVVHCKAGKGRTGTLIAQYLIHSGAVDSANAAIELFGNRRTRNGRGITIPSQARSVRYYALQRSALHRQLAEMTAAPSSNGSASSTTGAIVLAPPEPLSSTTGAAAAVVSRLTDSHDDAEAVRSEPSSRRQKQPQTPVRDHFPATAVVTRSEEEPELVSDAVRKIYTSESAASSPSAGVRVARTLLTLTVNRDWERRIGLVVDLDNFTQRPVITKFTGTAAAASSSPSSCHPGGNGGFIGAASTLLLPNEGGIQPYDDMPPGEAGNSVVPVPIHTVLRLRDELISVDGTSVSGLPYRDVIALLRNASDPFTITVARANRSAMEAAVRSPAVEGDVPPSPRPVSPPSREEGANAAASAASHTRGSPDAVSLAPPTAAALARDVGMRYLRRVAASIGPWAPHSNARVVPVPGIQLMHVRISHLPAAPSTGVLASCCSGGSSATAERIASDLVLQLYTGPNCRICMYDSRVRGNFASVTALEDAEGTLTDGAVWHMEAGAVSPLLSGDVRLVMRRASAGKKAKPLMQVWFHTACLPLPSELSALLSNQGVDVASDIGATTTNAAAAPRSGIASGVTSTASQPSAPHDAAPPPPPQSPIPTSYPFPGDVTGDPLLGGCPTLGACYTAAAAASPSTLATRSVDAADETAAVTRLLAASCAAPSALGSVTYAKSQIDYVLKDKKHVRFPACLGLTLVFRAIRVPREYAVAVCAAASGDTAADAASSTAASGSGVA